MTKLNLEEFWIEEHNFFNGANIIEEESGARESYSNAAVLLSINDDNDDML